MNIFVLHPDTTYAAQAHCDKHMKMVLETAQILSTVLRDHGVNYGYKAFNPNHPATRWAAKSKSNYVWLRDLGLKLAEEFTCRYGNEHKSAEVIREAPIPNLPESGLTPFAQCMPDEYLNPDAVQAYRAYYRGAKFDSGLITYTNREPPKWLSMAFKVKLNKTSIVYTATSRITGPNTYDWTTPV
jgi:hypothetical protein